MDCQEHVGTPLGVFLEMRNLESAAPCLVDAGVVDEGPVGGPVRRRRLVRDEDLVKGERFLDLYFLTSSDWADMTFTRAKSRS